MRWPLGSPVGSVLFQTKCGPLSQDICLKPFKRPFVLGPWERGEDVLRVWISTAGKTQGLAIGMTQE